MKAYRIGVVVLALCSLGFAVEKENDWQNLNQLTTGKKVEVVQTNLAKYKGEFVRFDEQSITLLVDGSERTIPREQVLRVSSVKHRIITPVLMSVAGMAVASMVFVGATGTDNPHDSRFNWVMPLGLAGGAAAGAVISTPHVYYRLARNPATPSKQDKVESDRTEH